MSEASTLREGIPKVFLPSSASATRLVHLIADEIAQSVPDHVLFSFPKKVSPKDGFVDVSARTFANAINRAAWYLRQRFGPPKNFETIGYSGSNDIRYFLFMFGAMKVGYKMLFLSPRNTLEGQLHVLEGVDCQRYLYAEGTNVSDILEKRTMDTHVVPELSAFLNKSPIEPYPYTKSFEEARTDPCLVLHTTGSTGLPKPITWKMGTWSSYEAWRTIPHVDGYVPTTEIYQESKRAYTSMPLFHTSGLNAGVTWSLLCGVTLVYGAPYVLPNAAYADEMHRYGGVDASMGAPSLYEELSTDAESLSYINKLHYVVASGAPLSDKAGKIISKHTRVISNLGATETACLQRLSPNIDDYTYFYWHPTHSGIEMREVDGLYELFLVKDEKLRDYQAIFCNFPEINEWSMQDLYYRHPDPAKPFLYKYACRRDDVIVLSNGEKIAPSLIEATLQSHRLVKGAMIVGRGKFQPAALIDLSVDFPQTPKERHAIIEQLLPVIQEANAHAPGHGKLDQFHILFADPAKPIVYLGQGKISRRRTYARYENELEELYRSAEKVMATLDTVAPLDFSSNVSIANWLRGLLQKVCGFTNLNPDQDLFALAMDSLQVIRIARTLRNQATSAGFPDSQAHRFTPKIVYANPTLQKLTSFIYREAAAHVATASVHSYMDKLIQDGRSPKVGKGASQPHSNGGESPADPLGSPALELKEDDPQILLDTAQKLLETYANNLTTEVANRTPSSKTVLLIGSTGSLGPYILDTLNRDPSVSQIVCLNRSPDAFQRHEHFARDRGLSLDILTSGRVEYLHANLAQPLLGLQPAHYDRLRQTVTHVIFNQWPVNFNWLLPSFEPYIRGVQNIIHFSYDSLYRSFILFVSSVSAASGFSRAPAVPEQIFTDLSVAAPIGYGQSKLIAENLLDRAARDMGVRSAIARVGIIAGPVGTDYGLWNRHEYIPSIIISSAAMGVLPATFPSRERVDWLPANSVANVLRDLLVAASSRPTSPGSAGASMYHVANPATTTWSALVPTIRGAYAKGKEVRTVSFEEWVATLAEFADKGDVDPDKVPAIRLLDFYQGLVTSEKKARRFETFNAERDSETLNEVGSVNVEWVRTWMRQWGV